MYFRHMRVFSRSPSECQRREGGPLVLLIRGQWSKQRRKRRACTNQALEMKPTQKFKLQPDIQQNKQFPNEEKFEEMQYNSTK